MKPNTIVAIIPAAGKARRLGSLPYSKELYPVLKSNKKGDESEITVMSHYLIDSLLYAGIRNINFVIRPEKTDIISYYKGGLQLNARFAYHIADYEYGVPFSINQVYPFIKNFNIAFGFPDIYIKPLNLFERLTINFKQNFNTDVLLGLIPIEDYLNWDMIDCREDGIVREIHLHNKTGKGLKYGWGLALWRPSFSKFLNEYLNNQLDLKSPSELQKNEFSIGSIFRQAIAEGLEVKGIAFDDAICIDAGTFEGIENVNSEIRKNQNQKSNI